MRKKSTRRNAYVLAMTLRHAGGNCTMRDRRRKRANNPKKSQWLDNEQGRTTK